MTIVLEILGRPKEHILEALNTLIERIGSEKGVKILNKRINEPIEVKDSKDLFTTFAELDLEVDSLVQYFGILFAYMPAHIEIIKPEKLSLSNFDLNEIGNRLAQRLHDYDAITKNSMLERDAIMRKLYEVAPHLFPKQSLDSQKSKEKPKKKRSKKSR